MRVSVTAWVCGVDGCDAVHVAPGGVDEHGAVNLVEGGVVVRDVEVTASAVAALSDDDVYGTFDVGVVLVDGSGDVAV